MHLATDKKITYQWRKGSVFSLDPQVAGEELERIRQDRNELTPDIIVDEARPDEAVLHNCFNWDDKAAAELYRKEQARSLVSSLVTVTLTGGKTLTKPQLIRVFHHIQGEYKPLTVVLNSKENMAELLLQARRDFNSFKNKYAALKELTGLFEKGEEIFKEQAS